MAIRITGMYSGLDTESIISELVSAQSVKKNKYVKEQTKLSWKMDAWKALNTKIYNFYTNTLDNMRWQSSFLKKAAKVSNSNALSVVASNNATDGIQTVSVDKLARAGKLTGRELGKDITSSSKLSDLGITGDASFEVTVGGKKTTIKMDGDMKISDLVKKLQNAGLNASFDDTNHRFFISSKETGEAANFTITANDEASLTALNALGLVSKEDLANDEYKLWASYATDQDAYAKAIAAEVQKRAEAYKKANDDLTAENESLQKEIEELKASDYKEGVSANDLYEELYGADGKGGLKQELKDLNAEIADLQKQLDEADESGKAALQTQIDEKKAAVDEKQARVDEIEPQYSNTKNIEDKQKQIEANKETIKDNEKYFTASTDEEGNTIVSEKDGLITAQVTKEFDAKVALAQSVVGSIGENGSTKFGDSQYAIKVEGQDAEITLDGAKFKSSTNDFNVNGMTITVHETTQTDATITTSRDVDGIYDMIKNFFSEYNSLINEMSALYNADSSKGYDPLLSEEKAELSDSEIEEWEKKIKDSLLRRDATLGDLSDAIKSVMIQGATVNGTKMYLSDFGINTLGFFNAAENEKSAYHIDGNADDANVKGNEDKLRSMLASDPDTVMDFFTGLANNLYDKLTSKMSGIKDTRSAFTVYNDKTMQKEYNDYKERIAKEEDKLNALMDKWYKKFSQMETTLAKLQSKSSGLGNMLGGS